ncbi:beta-propeller fold lactonase family protein [Allorhizocola rhizosphaerae]|uniref:YVTN family beta-propeller repeat protein n=1 Tax=Allorhizocola rhizosphaerae TaxID=1872709 RepID=UPI000E3CDB3A|nr:beta-propeller fold lactonase family protein [Allorhizocola rhizosphaerae]
MRRVLVALLTVCLSTACAETVTVPEPKVEDTAAPVAAGEKQDLLAGMPEYPSLDNVYAAAGANMMREDVRGDRELVYVPNTNSDRVHVIDPNTMQVIDEFYGGPEPQHVVPSYDMRTLYVTSSRVPGGAVLPIDPRTGKPGELIEVQDVYNLYYTPDGQHAIVVAEAYQRLDFYHPKTWELVRSTHFPDCEGINHMDFSADGKIALASCEFANRMVVIDVATGEQLRQFDLDVVPDGMPQDTRLVPDGSAFLVADMHAHGLYVFDSQATARIGYIPTGQGAHGIYFSRDSKSAYVSNRSEGTITVLDLASMQPRTKWTIPGGGSPDMGGVSADGNTLWLTGRYHGEVYAIDTNTGELKGRIPVGAGPHGLIVWPQPGRYSLGHTGNIR